MVNTINFLSSTVIQQLYCIFQALNHQLRGAFKFEKCCFSQTFTRTHHNSTYRVRLTRILCNRNSCQHNIQISRFNQSNNVAGKKVLTSLALATIELTNYRKQRFRAATIIRVCELHCLVYPAVSKFILFRFIS